MLGGFMSGSGWVVWPFAYHFLAYYCVLVLVTKKRDKCCFLFRKSCLEFLYRTPFLRLILQILKKLYCSAVFFPFRKFRHKFLFTSFQKILS